MTILWISYAWTDNKNGDVDFIDQELTSAGLTVTRDVWELDAGKRLWEQIEKSICDPAQSNAWLLFMTQASLLSEPCREEYSYALGRALGSRGATFPVIGLSYGSVDSDLIPAGIKNRLYVSLDDPNWKERIVASVEGRKIDLPRATIDPYHYQFYQPPGSRKYVLELRPRAGSWCPAFAGIPAPERLRCNPSISIGPSGAVPSFSILSTGEQLNPSGEWWMVWTQNPVTPTTSLFVYMDEMPSCVAFGDTKQQPKFMLNIDRSVYPSPR